MVLGGSQALPKECCSWQGRGLRREEIGTYRSAPLFQAHNEKEARRLVEGGLSARELESLPGSDVRKVALASLILERTVARQSWIADKLAMRSAANVSQQVRPYRARRSRLPAALKEYLQSVKIC
jgi:putative transposase